MASSAWRSWWTARWWPSSSTAWRARAAPTRFSAASRTRARPATGSPTASGATCTRRPGRSARDEAAGPRSSLPAHGAHPILHGRLIAPGNAHLDDGRARAPEGVGAQHLRPVLGRLHPPGGAAHGPRHAGDVRGGVVEVLVRTAEQ